MDFAKDFIDEYIKKLSEETHLHIFWADGTEFCEVTIPFLDIYNDYIQIYIDKTDDKYWLCDHGFIDDYLRNLKKKKRKKLIEYLKNKIDIEIKWNDYTVEVDEQNFMYEFNKLIQAMTFVERYCDMELHQFS